MLKAEPWRQDKVKQKLQIASQHFSQDKCDFLCRMRHQEMSTAEQSLVQQGVIAVTDWDSEILQVLYAIEDSDVEFLSKYLDSGADIDAYIQIPHELPYILFR